MNLRAGIDVGSTTVKLVVLDDNQEMLFSKYERHYSDVKKATEKILKEAQSIVGDQNITMSITGSRSEERRVGKECRYRRSEGRDRKKDKRRYRKSEGRWL